MWATSFLRYVDKYIFWLVWVGVVLYFVEAATGSEHSYAAGMMAFLWVERVIASIFIVEYFIRWYEDRKNPDGTMDIGYNYPLSIMGAVDLLCWLPFLMGFFVPVSWLGWIRTLRILRLLKFFRYSKHLQLVALGFYKSWAFLKPLAFGMIVVCLFSSAVMYECERVAQPDSYGNIFNCFWFSIVSATTVGYGDMYPVTLVGKICAGVILFIPALFIFSAIVGAISNGFGIVMEAEEDPTINPMDEFRKIYERRQNEVRNR